MSPVIVQDAAIAIPATASSRKDDEVTWTVLECCSSSDPGWSPDGCFRLPYPLPRYRSPIQQGKEWAEDGLCLPRGLNMIGPHGSLEPSGISMVPTTVLAFTMGLESMLR